MVICSQTADGKPVMGWIYDKNYDSSKWLHFNTANGDGYNQAIKKDTAVSSSVRFSINSDGTFSHYTSDLTKYIRYVAAKY